MGRSSKPLNWRIPDDIRAWLEAQPDGLSKALERVCRDAMAERKSAREIALEGALEELRRIVTAPASQETTNPAPTKAPGDGISNMW